MLRRFALACTVLCSFLAAGPAAAHAQAPSPIEAETLDAINAERERHGLPAVTHAPAISSTCRSYGRRMLARDRWAHAGSVRVKGFRGIAEILGRAPAGTSTSVIIKSWLKSPVHRRVLLGKRYRHVGVGTATGKMGGRSTTVWVVRFAR